MSPFLLCRGVVVPWRCRGGCVVHYASVTLRVLRCVALRVLCCVAVVLRLRYVAVAFRCASGRCASSQAVLFRFGWLSPAAPGRSVLFRAPPSTKSAFLCAFWLRDPHFLAFRAQNRGFCVRMGDFSEIFGLFDTKIGFLCSGSITMVVPANHRAHFKNVNPL